MRFLLCLLVLSCTGRYHIKATGDLSFQKSSQGILEHQNLTRWSYFWDESNNKDILLPQDLNFAADRPLRDLKIHSYFTTQDTFLGVIPFVERRHFEILYNYAGQEDYQGRD